MRIGFVAAQVHRHGGQERALAEVIDCAANKHDVVVFARICELTGPRIQWVPINAVARPSMLRVWDFARRVRRIAPKFHCDIINSVGSAAGEAEVITAQFCHAAFFDRFGTVRGPAWHERPYQHFAEQWFIAGERQAYSSPRLKKVIAVSQGIKRELMQYYNVPDSMIEVIPNAVDHDRFAPAESARAKAALREKLGLPDCSLLCLFAGGDWERKGVRDAIEAVAGVDGVYFVVVGSGNIPAFLAMAQQAGAGDQVKFVGHSSIPEQYYAAADLFIFPSRYEAFSLVTIEAAASGLPIIARRINGTEELIEHGVNGYFIDEDDVTIRSAVIALRDDRAKLEQMSHAALERSRHYDWSIVAAEQISVFEQAARNQP